MTKHALRLSAFVALLALVGCGGNTGKTGATATVTGKVTLPGGKPLPGGRINFQSSADPSKTASGDIKADGTYEAKNVPQGECKVGVINDFLKPVANPTSADQKPDPSLKYVPIQEQYTNPAKSGLKATISGPTATYDAEVK